MCYFHCASELKLLKVQSYGAQPKGIPGNRSASRVWKGGMSMFIRDASWRSKL